MRARWSAVLIVFATCTSAWADGVHFPSEKAWREFRERSLVSEPTQKAVVMLHGGVETLIVSPGFAGDAADFAWVIPVPKRPKVEIVKGALFHELARLVAPRMPQGRYQGKAMESRATADGVTVLERKPVGAYDVSVLSATDPNALMHWLARNGYHMPPSAAKPIAQYVRERWTFVASRVRVPKAAKGLSTGSLAPLKLTFRSGVIVYPMRLSSANPDVFDLLLYVVTPSGHHPRKVAGPEDYGAFLYPQPQHIETTTANSPTLVGLTGRTSLAVTWCHFPKFDPKSCKSDFVWKVN